MMEWWQFEYIWTYADLIQVKTESWRNDLNIYRRFNFVTDAIDMHRFANGKLVYILSKLNTHTHI